MDFPLHTDALLYVVVAKSILAVLLIIAGIAAIFVGARLFQLGLNLTPEAAEHPSEAEHAYKRLSKDTLLPRGTYIRAKADDERFTRLDKDRWVSAGTLMRVALTNAETKRDLQMSGALLMASSLLWGFLAYLSSPLDIQRINKALEVSQEHRVSASLTRIEASTAALHTQVSSSHEKLNSLQADAQQTAKAVQLEDLLQHTQSANAQLGADVQKLHGGLSEVKTHLADTQKIDAVQATLQRSNTQLEQIETNLRSVQTDVQAVKTLATDTQAIADKEKALQQAVQQEIQQGQAQWQTELARLQDTLEQMQSHIETHIQGSTTQLQTEAQRAFAQQKTLLETHLSQLQAAPEQADLQPLQQQMRAMQENLQSLQVDVSQLLKNTAHTEAMADNNATVDLLGIQQQLSDLSHQLEQLPQQTAVLTSAVAPATAQQHFPELATLQGDIAALSGQLDKLSQQVTEATPAAQPATVQQNFPELATLQGDIAAIKQQVQHLPENVSNLQQNVQNLRDELAKLKTSAVQTAAASKQIFNTQATETETAAADHATPEAHLKATAVEPIAHPLVKKLLDSNTPTVENGGAYVDIPVVFASGSADQLRDEDPLKELGKALQSPHLRDKQILIQGYTDRLGSDAVNLQLSEKRANFVREWLLKHVNLPADKLHIEGKGEADPIASNATAAGRATNRRVRIVIK